MKVILLDYVYKQGVAGEVINVADGFARNYLIPRGLAVQATQGELKRSEKLRDQAVAKRAALENQMNELAHAIDGVELVFGRRAASTGKLFGSVTTQEIADALNEQTGVDINRRRISQQGLREIGTHPVTIRLGSEVTPSVQVTIVPEDELDAFLAKREAGEDVDAAAAEGEAAEDIADAEAVAEDGSSDVVADIDADDAAEEADEAADSEAADEDSDEAAEAVE